MNEPNYIELPKDVRCTKGSKLPMTKIPKKTPTSRMARHTLPDQTINLSSMLNREYIPATTNSIERNQIQYHDQNSQVGFDDFPPPWYDTPPPPNLNNPLCIVEGGDIPTLLLEPMPNFLVFLEHHSIVVKWIVYLFMKTFGLLYRSLMLLIAALPILLIIFAIWAYKYGEPLIRMEKAVKELWKDRTVSSTGWIRF